MFIIHIIKTTARESLYRIFNKTTPKNKPTKYWYGGHGSLVYPHT